jgi:hypothetical protein
MDVQLITSASSAGWLRSSMAIEMLCSVSMVFFRDSIELKIWTSFVPQFDTKIRHPKREAIKNLLSLKQPDYSPPLS